MKIELVNIWSLNNFVPHCAPPKSQVGVIVDIRRPADDKGRPVGHCFVQYSNPQEAEAAMQLNQQELMGRSITIEMSTAGAQGTPKPTGKPVDSCWFCLSNPSC
eukprot:scaffold185453_cov44-Prasinocladus_malaysianus.AAC.1